MIVFTKSLNLFLLQLSCQFVRNSNRSLFIMLCIAHGLTLIPFEKFCDCGGESALRDRDTPLPRFAPSLHPHHEALATPMLTAVFYCRIQVHSVEIVVLINPNYFRKVYNGARRRLEQHGRNRIRSQLNRPNRPKDL